MKHRVSLAHPPLAPRRLKILWAGGEATRERTLRGVSDRTLAPWAEASSRKGPRLPIGPESRGEGGWQQQDTQLVGV